MADAERVHAETVGEWRAWLVAHHATSTGAWLVSWRRETGRPSVSYEDAVLEALTVGWVDSRAARLDDERSMLMFTPRRSRSGWSRSNKERVAMLSGAGRMLPAGEAAVEAAKANGTWTLLDDVEDLVVPDDLAAAFDARPGALQHWDALPRSPRRAALLWLLEARKAETRAARVARIAERCEAGERPVP